MRRLLFLLALLILSLLPGRLLAHLEVDLPALGLVEGNIVGSSNLNDPDIFIINEAGYRRLFLSPVIFGFYGHLRYDGVKRLDDALVDKMIISTLFRNCETGDPKVYALQTTGEDAAVLHWVNMTGEQASAEDPEFFHKIFCINSREFNWYAKGSAYTSLSQAPVYRRDVPVQGINETNIPLTVPAGFRISLFTPQAVGPLRFMAFSPDGILFVSMPSSKGLYGGGGVDDGKVFALPDRDGNGKADEVRTVLSGLHLPHGLAFHAGYLYVAEEGLVLRYPYTAGGTLGEREVITTLPAGGEHVSRTIRFSPTGKMYVSVGSPCNNCETSDERTASVWEFNDDGTGGRVYASGIRNAVGLAFDVSTGQLWATENGRDFLGDDLPPDEVNIIRDGRNYGWPLCYGKQTVDSAYNGSVFCRTTEPSVHELQAHSAPLGLAFISGSQFPAQWAGDLLVARHGSWNRSQPVGYDVVRLDVQGNNVISEHPFITGWLTSSNAKLGRPVDVIFGPDGVLYISDDKANVVYRVSKTP